MHFVVASIVKPLTKSKRVSFVSLWGGRQVDYFVSLGNTWQLFWVLTTISFTYTLLVFVHLKAPSLAFTPCNPLQLASLVGRIHGAPASGTLCAAFIPTPCPRRAPLLGLAQDIGFALSQLDGEHHNNQFI